MVPEQRLEVLLSKLGRLVRVKDVKSSASIIEQMMSSGLNMVISFSVVYSAGVTQFGIFSFFFVLSTLVNGLYLSVIHRQMLLHSSPEPTERQNSFFLHSLVLNLILFSIIAVLALFLTRLVVGTLGTKETLLVLSVLVYVLFFNLYDLFKQFLYTKHKQVYSLRCTISWITTTLVLIVLVSLFVPDHLVVTFSYLAMACGVVTGLLSNKYCRATIHTSQWEGIANTIETFKIYWKQGRFGTFGMMAAWVQSQSLNPLMMFLGGPLLAGYVSLGRLFVMPMAVVNQGLINSSTPTLRNTFYNSGRIELIQAIKQFIKINFSFAFVYILALGIAYKTGLLETIIPEYDNVIYYIGFWTLFLAVSMHRYWCAQYFMVQLELKLILKITLIAISVFILGTLLSINVFKNIYLILVFMLIAELLSTALLIKKRLQLDKQESLNLQH